MHVDLSQENSAAEGKRSNDAKRNSSRQLRLTENSAAEAKQTKKRKSTKKMVPLWDRVTAILEDDEDPLTSDVGVQASMCSCDMSDIAVVVVTDRSRDVCLQTNLCRCSAYVGNVGSAASTHAATHTTQQSDGVVQPAAHVGENLQVPDISVEGDFCEQSKVMVDIDGVCKEMEACDLDDTMQYEYTCVTPGAGDSAEDQTGVAAGVEWSAPKNVVIMPDSSLPDIVISKASPLFEDDVNKSASLNAVVIADQSQTQPSSDARRAGVPLVRSSADMFSDDYEKTDNHASLHTTSTGDKSLIDSGSAVVHDRGATQLDGSILVSMYNVSLQTSAAEEDVIDAGNLPDTETEDADLLPLTNACPDSYNRSSCRTLAYTSDKLDDEVFESEHAAACTVLKAGSRDASGVQTFPDLDEPSDLDIDAGACDSLSDESGAEVIVSHRPRSSADPSLAARRLLSSTAIATPPEPIFSFFGVAGSSVSGSDQSPKYSVDGGRRKSKHGRKRVSMCGEYDSPTEFVSPQRSPGVFAGQLTMVVDTDEEGDGSTLPNAVYTTANEGLVPDTASESEDVSDDESDRPAVDGCDQDAPPLDASELCQDETEPVSREPAGTSGLGERAPMQPSTEECSFDVSSGSDLSFKATVASDAAKSANKNRFEQNVFVLVLSSDFLKLYILMLPSYLQFFDAISLATGWESCLIETCCVSRRWFTLAISQNLMTWPVKQKQHCSNIFS